MVELFFFLFDQVSDWFSRTLIIGYHYNDYYCGKRKLTMKYISKSVKSIHYIKMRIFFYS